jgi:transcription antitermination factor NusG
MSQKDFLEPRDKYDKAIISNKSNKTKYCFYELIDIIITSIDQEEENENEEFLWHLATEIFWKDLHSQKAKKQISFNFKLKYYYLIKAKLPDQTVEYVKSTTYPGKAIYSSVKSAEKAIERYQNKSFPLETIFEIEEHENEVN